MGAKFRRVSLCLIAVCVTIGGVARPSASHHFVAIQPGVESPGARIPAIGVPPFQFTYNFVFRGSNGERYIGVPAHGVTKVGQRVNVADVGRIGTVAWIAPPSPDRDCGEFPRPDDVEPCIDFGLVRIDKALYGHIDASVRHWGGPTGVVPREEIVAGTIMHQYGYGSGPHAHELARARTGMILGTLGCGYQASLPISTGDSGSPAILADGRALGFMTLTEGGGTIGVMLDCVVDAMKAHGLKLKLETAPLTDAVGREAKRLDHVTGTSVIGDMADAVISNGQSVVDRKGRLVQRPVR